jgi:hypothetical protein
MPLSMWKRKPTELLRTRVFQLYALAGWCQFVRHAAVDLTAFSVRAADVDVMMNLGTGLGGQTVQIVVKRTNVVRDVTALINSFKCRR